MAKSNRDRVGSILDLLKRGLCPFVLRQYKARYRMKYLQEMELALYNPPFSVSLPDEASATEKLDAQAFLKLAFYRWKEAFSDKLGHSERSYISELMEARNKWAHQEAFTNDQAYRIVDTATLLLEAVGAANEAEAAAEHARELLRIRFEREAAKSVKAQERVATPMDASARHTPVGLKPWRQVVQPHPDVHRGEFTLSEFSADLAQVHQGLAKPEYGDAQEFFKRTFLTRGLQDLIVNCFLRLNGAGADPVVELQTNFGGGKTHSLLALYHLAGGIQLRTIPGAEDIVQRIGDVDDYIQCERAVIVGTDFDGTQPRDYADCSTHNLWGEIAYQLGGAAGYDMVKAADQSGVSPGASTLRELLEKHGPALIIIDEFVAHARNLYNAKGGRYSASFEALMTFVQALTEAVRRTSDALLLVSLPVSELEAGGAGGKEALDFVSNTLGRMQSVWKPVSAVESFEIVRRRLFSDAIDRPARDAVVRAFAKMYRDSPGEFPRDAVEIDYLQRLEQAYPIHPELFERLYNDWSTLEGFQQTRGVLRLMATVIHRLWMDNDHGLLILPGNVPLWEGKVLHEILRYLPGNWTPIIEQDIDGGRSKPFQQDQDNKRFGEYMASRRVARAVFMGSAPSSPAQQTRGLTQEQVHLATTQPGEAPSVFNDALRRMADQLSFLYRSETRYWYDTRPTLNRTAAERARHLEDYTVLAEAAKRLRAQKWDKRALGSVHIMPEGSAEIPDEQSARVVVLAPEFPHKKGDSASAAMSAIKDIMGSRGNSPRHHRNMLVFIAPDDRTIAAWLDSMRKYLAWQSIQADAEALNLDHQQSKQAQAALQRESETVDNRLQEAYRWLIAPRQPQPTGDIDYEAVPIRKGDNFLEGAARRLQSDEWLIHRYAPDMLLEELVATLDIWQKTPHLSVKKLWEWLTKYCYLPRLFDRKVLEAALMDGVNQIEPVFGYASGVTDTGDYVNLEWGKSITVSFDDAAVIVHPAAAKRQLAVDSAEEESDSAPVSDNTDTSITKPNGTGKTPPPPPEKKKTRYYGEKTIPAAAAKRDLAMIADEILQHLASLPSADAEVSVHISGYCPAGFDAASVRALKENSKTLGLHEYGFEER